MKKNENDCCFFGAPTNKKSLSYPEERGGSGDFDLVIFWLCGIFLVAMIVFHFDYHYAKETATGVFPLRIEVLGVMSHKDGTGQRVIDKTELKFNREVYDNGMMYFSQGWSSSELKETFGLTLKDPHEGQVYSGECPLVRRTGNMINNTFLKFPCSMKLEKKTLN